MAHNSTIEWTEVTWNPVTGCDRISPGCDNCYALTMAATPQHTYQILTKRPLRAARLADDLPWPPNVWLGVSVETPAQTNRIDQLRRIPAAVRFISAEPLLAALPNLDLDDIHWMIVGGESGPGHRPIQPTGSATSATNPFRPTSRSSSNNGAACDLRATGANSTATYGTKCHLQGISRKNLRPPGDETPTQPGRPAKVAPDC